jgi:hypothetical protein
VVEQARRVGAIPCGLSRIHHAAYANFNTTGSCSFISDPSFVYRDTQTVTLYLNEALVRGIEPT